MEEIKARRDGIMIQPQISALLIYSGLSIMINLEKV